MSTKELNALEGSGVIAPPVLNPYDIIRTPDGLVIERPFSESEYLWRVDVDSSRKVQITNLQHFMREEFACVFLFELAACHSLIEAQLSAEAYFRGEA